MYRRLTIRVAAICACAAGVLLPAAFAHAAVLAGNTGWSWGNPSPQPNALHAADAADGRIFAGGDSGTLTYSDDAGSTWQGVSTGVLDPVLHVVALRSTSVVFATRCGLRRTDDAGQSVHILPWRADQSDCPSAIVGVAFPSLSKGYLALADGSSLVTGDGGFSWSPLPPLPGTPAAGGAQPPESIAFVSETEGVAVVGNAILHTADGGASWQTSLIAPAPLHAAGFADPGNGFVVGDGGAAWHSADGGVNFTPLVAGAGVGQHSLSRLNCTVGLGCVATGGLRSAAVAVSAAGTQLLAPPAIELIGDVVPTATGLLAVGARGEVARSPDAGATWHRLSSRVDAAFTGLRSKSKNLAVAFGRGGAVARSSDAGASWQQMSTGSSRNLLDASLVSENRGWAIDDAYRLFQVLPTGAAAASVGGPMRFKPRAVHAVDASRVLLVGARGLRVWTARNGAKPIKGKVARAALDSLDSSGPALVAFGSRAAFVSSRGARSWKKIKLPPTGTIASLDFVTKSRGYVLDARGELWYTANRGGKWRRIDTTGDTSFTSVAFSGESHGYLASASGRILRTADGGSTWTRQFPFFDSAAASPIAIEATGRNTALAVATGSNRLFATTTGGQAGSSMRLRIGEGDALFRRRGSVQVVGRVLPAKGGEQVTVLARAKSAKPGTKWVSRTVTADATGHFATLWKISQRTVFVARWSGDAGRESVGAVPLVLKPAGKR